MHPAIRHTRVLGQDVCCCTRACHIPVFRLEIYASHLSARMIGGNHPKVNVIGEKSEGLIVILPWAVRESCSARLIRCNLHASISAAKAVFPLVSPCPDPVTQWLVHASWAPSTRDLGVSPSVHLKRFLCWAQGVRGYGETRLPYGARKVLKRTTN